MACRRAHGVAQAQPDIHWTGPRPDSFPQELRSVGQVSPAGPGQGRTMRLEPMRMIAVVTLSLCGCATIARSMQSPVERLDERGVSAPSLTVEVGSVLQFVNADTHAHRSEEHTSELQSHSDLVCRLLLENKNDRPAGRPV